MQPNIVNECENFYTKTLTCHFPEIVVLSWHVFGHTLYSCTLYSVPSGMTIEAEVGMTIYGHC